MQTTFLSLKELVANVQNRLSRLIVTSIVGTAMSHTLHQKWDLKWLNASSC